MDQTIPSSVITMVTKDFMGWMRILKVLDWETFCAIWQICCGKWNCKIPGMAEAECYSWNHFLVFIFTGTSKNVNFSWVLTYVKLVQIWLCFRLVKLVTSIEYYVYVVIFFNWISFLSDCILPVLAPVWTFHCLYVI